MVGGGYSSSMVLRTVRQKFESAAVAGMSRWKVGPTLVFSGGAADVVELGWASISEVPLAEGASCAVSAAAPGCECLHDSR